MRHSESIDAIAAALAKAQASMGHAVKDRTNPHMRNKYATLVACIDAVRGPLSANGIALAQSGTYRPEDSTVVVTTMLLHSSGQWLAADTSFAPSALATKGASATDAQSIGSAITYGKRYGLMAMVGISSEDEDDDGNAASGRQAPAREQPSTTTGRAPDAKAADAPDIRAVRMRAATKMRSLGLFDAAIAKFGAIDGWTMESMRAMADTASWAPSGLAAHTNTMSQ